MFSGRRLKTRLIFWTTAIVVLAVGGSLELRTRVTASMLESDLRERSRTLTRAAIRTFELRAESLSPAVLGTRLQDFVDADPAMSRMDLVRSGAATPRLVASSADMTESLVASLPSNADTWIEMRGRRRELITMEPIAGSPYWIVASTSLEGLDRYVAVSRVWAAVFSGGLIVLVVGLMSFMFDRLVSRRFDRLLSDLNEASDEGYDASGEPRDEIGLLAAMFADLLTRVHTLNRDLQAQVEDATASLNRRNRRLEETTQELILMQKKLLQSERLATIGQMAATFAHEIGSPLSSLSAHIQLLLEERNLVPEHRETLETIRGELHSLVEIVSELLRSARRGPEDFVAVDMRDIAESVLRLVDPRLRSQSITVAPSLGSVPAIRGYPLYLQEALLNLINNASEAMPGGGRLALAVWHDEESGRVRVRVADSGPGIDPTIVERVFETFVTTRDLGTGTGLGLAIAREIMNSHNGTIELESSNGHGTAALLSFPVMRDR
jgi:signal transduction histidine kinase